MEREYYTEETYRRLLSELCKLEEEKEELKKEYDNDNIEFQTIDDKIITLHHKIYLLYEKNKEFIKTEIDKLDGKLLTTATIISILNFISAIGILLYLRNTNASITTGILVGYGDGAIISFGLFTGIRVYLAKILEKRKEKKLKESIEYTDTLSEIERLKIEKKLTEEKQEIIKEKYENSFKKYESINSDVLSKKEEINNFERDYINLHLLQTQVEKTEAKPKTKALVKPNN